YENKGNQNISAHTINNNVDYAQSVYAADVDGDGEMDVLSASSGQYPYSSEIAWYKNDGNENFTHYNITNSAKDAMSVYAIDRDGDGDMDVLSASYSDNKIAWYENLGPVGIGDKNSSKIPHKLFLYQNYPNPFNPSTKITFNLPRTSKVTLEIFNILGKEVATLVSGKLSAGSHSYQWSKTEGMASGIYLYRLEADGFVRTRKMILMK
ncbi:MAG: FG-GAP-like repeat-containing protein, partial [Calditrichota bacterium]